jgi:hypothetical protein
MRRCVALLLTVVALVPAGCEKDRDAPTASAASGPPATTGGAAASPAAAARDAATAAVAVRDGAAEVGLLAGDQRELLEKVAEQADLDAELDKAMAGLRDKPVGGGSGAGAGGGPGEGTGTTRGDAGGGGGGAVTSRELETGSARLPRRDRPRVGLGSPAGSLDSGLGKAEIEKVVRSRAGVLRACYQREVNRTPGLAGTLVVAFTVRDHGGRGMVTGARVVADRSTLSNAKVEACVVRQFKRMIFPARGGAVVTGYPLIFATD